MMTMMSWGRCETEVP